MSVDPQAAAAALLGQQAQTVGGVDSAGIYGDQAGAAQHAPGQSDAAVAAGLVAQGAQPASVDVGALQARLEQLEKKQAADAQAAAVAAEAAAPKPPTLLEIASNLAPSLAHAFQVVEERLGKLEGGDKPAPEPQ